MTKKFLRDILIYICRTKMDSMLWNTGSSRTSPSITPSLQSTQLLIPPNPSYYAVSCLLTVDYVALFPLLYLIYFCSRVSSVVVSCRKALLPPFQRLSTSPVFTYSNSVHTFVCILSCLIVIICSYDSFPNYELLER